MKEMKVRELIPPMYPSEKFTIAEARQAWREAEAEDDARREATRKRSRAASDKTVPSGPGDP